eukprot:CAMPEP_0174264650 /NCGR_PEP_ID=MMETSP0439-20130205/23300_1 /TAXON_ID=0 /ORGANISM="Stereomyxa ramosa, Strain Chinc5" /LENGTH=462 /DNA_ID=CAMNT_0015350649 /DNA_START=68 /DNA_END=1456 /DNA_ORIENTATION=-
MQSESSTSTLLPLLRLVLSFFGLIYSVLRNFVVFVDELLGTEREKIRNQVLTQKVITNTDISTTPTTTTTTLTNNTPGTPDTVRSKERKQSKQKKVKGSGSKGRKHTKVKEKKESWAAIGDENNKGDNNNDENKQELLSTKKSLSPRANDRLDPKTSKANDIPTKKKSSANKHKSFGLKRRSSRQKSKELVVDANHDTKNKVSNKGAEDKISNTDSLFAQSIFSRPMQLEDQLLQRQREFLNNNDDDDGPDNNNNDNDDTALSVDNNNDDDNKVVRHRFVYRQKSIEAEEAQAQTPQNNPTATTKALYRQRLQPLQQLKIDPEELQKKRKQQKRLIRHQTEKSKNKLRKLVEIETVVTDMFTAKIKKPKTRHTIAFLKEKAKPDQEEEREKKPLRRPRSKTGGSAPTQLPVIETAANRLQKFKSFEELPVLHASDVMVWKNSLDLENTSLLLPLRDDHAGLN